MVDPSTRGAAVVIGGGVGGLAAAIRLACAGRVVTLVERNEVLGGKLAEREIGGYRFEIGPSLLTLPQIADDLFRVAGTSLEAEVDLIRLDPQMRYRWTDGSALDVHDDAAATERAIEEFTPGNGETWRRFTERGERIWEISERTFFAGAMTGPVSLLRRMRSPMDLVRIDPIRSLSARAAQWFDDPRLVQWAGRYATYSGSSPFEAPATLACIPAVESRYGAWAVRGGLVRLRDALVRTAERVGVQLRVGCEVRRVTTGADGAVDGVELVNGERIGAQVVVANVDARHLYTDLLPEESALRSVQRSKPSTSGFVLLLGVRGLTPGVAHHNVYFSDDDRAEFEALRRGAILDEPTVYACVSSVTDPSQAPDGCENWFLLVNVPAGVVLDRERETARVMTRLTRFGVDLRDRIDVMETMSPADIEERYRTPGGAIYGTSSNGRSAAFLRPRNRGARKGLYLVGGSSHPGGGIPLVMTSGRIVADMVEEDFR